MKPRARALVDTNRFGYLSTKDAALIRDAVLLECDTFLTLDRKLARNADHMSRELGLEVLRPPGLYEVLRPTCAVSSTPVRLAARTRGRRSGRSHPSSPTLGSLTSLLGERPARLASASQRSSKSAKGGVLGASVPS